MNKSFNSQTGFKRLFIAIKIDPDQEFLNAYLKIKNRLSGEKIRWVKTENLHITLRFLGDTSVNLIPLISSKLSLSFGDIKPFNLNLTGAGVFRSPENPKVFWIGIQNPEDLTSAKGNMDFHLKSLIDLQETENEYFHLTLARMKSISDKTNLKEIIRSYYNFNFITTRVEKIILFESILGKTGPVYNELKDFLLLR
jgi:2'-5' RNA ligase